MDQHTQDQSQESGAQARLKCGVILDGGAIEVWQVECLAGLHSSAGVSLELAVVFPRSGGGHRGRGASSAQPVAGPAILEGVPRLNCAPKQQRDGTFTLAESEVTDIRRRKLDFIIDFGNRRLCGKALDTAELGVWSFSFSDPGLYPDGLPGIHELQSGDPSATARLVRLGADSRAAVLRRGVFPVTRDSVTETVDRIYYGISGWPAQAVTDLVNGCADYLLSPQYKLELRHLVQPGAGGAVSLGLRTGLEMVKRLWRAAFMAEEWNVGIVRQPIESFLHFSDGYQVDWLHRPKRGTFIADPFGVVSGGERCVFYEDFNYEDRRGFIAGAVVEGDPPLLRDAAVAIERGVHLSYPFIIEDQGVVYCIPESRATGELHLYRARRLPHEWEHAATLLSDVDAIDPTVFRHDGRWWLMFVSKDPRTHTELLKIYHAPALTGPWESHANNPVKADVHTTRPGGTPFECDGELYRPVQDCGETYGRRVLINRITKLTPVEFTEETVSAVEPPQGTPWNRGLHTLSALGDWTLIDAKRFVFVPGVLGKKITGLFRKLFERKKQNGE